MAIVAHVAGVKNVARPDPGHENVITERDAQENVALDIVQNHQPGFIPPEKNVLRCNWFCSITQK